MRIIFRTLALAGFLFACASQTHASLMGGGLLAPGEVTQAHAKTEADCDKCHKQFDKAAQPQLCINCHKKVGMDIAEKHGFHGRAKEEKECRECHTEHRGRNASTVILDTSKFDHEQTDFLLKGKHFDARSKCSGCHLPNKKFNEAPATCNGCHTKDDKHKGELGNDCAKCHTENGWKTTKVDHDKTNFKLLDKHLEVKCDSCHIAGKFKDTPRQCSVCHKDEDDKIHKGKFGAKCETCHAEKGWKEVLFDHNKKTRFPLLGKHFSPVQCVSCHKGDLYKDKLQTACVSCHKKDDDKVHKGKFGSKCETCHAEQGWQEILFDHNKMTKFTLFGKHLLPTVKCVSCHKGDLYNDKPQMACGSCHKKNDGKIHNSSSGIKCASCHVERGWKEVMFDHNKWTKFSLLGKHLTLKCVSCHKGDLYKDKLQTDCYSCHQSNDKHKGQEGTKCESCHTEGTWNKTKFDHNQAHFPLIGKHNQVECKKCHATVMFKDVKSTCVSCHKTQDAHKRRLGLTCETCHTPRDWKAWNFDHNKTSFKLEAWHEKLSCYKCHKKEVVGKLKLVGTCSSCHSKDELHNGQAAHPCSRCHVEM